MSLGATLMASFLVTLGRPATWPLALVAFLVRGGVLIVLAPIVVLPSAVGLANVVTPLLTSLVFGGLSGALLVLGVAAILIVVGWLIIGGLVAAAAEGEMTRLVATDEDVRAAIAVSGREPEPGGARRILAVRLIAQIPLAIALAWGGARVVASGYRELTVPSDVATPVAVRIVGGAPEAIGLILAAWLTGQVVGALAARRVILAGDRVPTAVRAALVRLVRHPVRTLAVELLPLFALVAVLVPSAAASGAAWDAVRASLSTGAGALAAVAVLGPLVGLWIGGLALAAAISAWRAAAWTVEVTGTMGATPAGRVGD